MKPQKRAARLSNLSELVGVPQRAVPQRQPRPAADKPPSPLHALVVWGVWTLALVGAVAFVWNYGSTVPYRVDDWSDAYSWMLRDIAGFRQFFWPDRDWNDYSHLNYLDGPITIYDLWAPTNGHRHPVPILTINITSKLTGGSYFWTQQFLTVFILAGLALAMVLAVKRLRGWTSYTDAFFPLMLINGGMTDGLLLNNSGNLIFYFAPSVLACIFLLTVVWEGTRFTLGAGVLAGFCLLLLAGWSTGGVVYVPPLALWLIYAGVRRWRSPGAWAKTSGTVVLLFAGVALSVVGLYFIGYHNSSSDVASPTWFDTLKNSLAFLTSNFGSAGEAAWPYSGVALAGVLALSAGILGVMLVRRYDAERSRPLGLLFVAGGIAGITLAVGYGRANTGFNYHFLAIPAVCWPYLTLSLYQANRVRYLAQGLLVTLLGAAVLASLVNTRSALGYAQEIRAVTRAVEQKLRAGVPVYELVAFVSRAGESGGYSDEDFANRILTLRRRNFSIFRRVRDNPPFREEQLPADRGTPQAIRWEGDTAHGEGPDSYLEFSLPEPRRVAGVRIRLACADDTPAAANNHTLQIHWRSPGEEDFSGKARTAAYNSGEAEVLFYVADTIQQIRIYPDDKPFACRFSEITLLIPE